MEALPDLTEPLWNMVEHYRTLQSVAGHYGTPRKRYGTLQNYIMEPLWGITETLRKHYRAVTEHCGSVMECKCYRAVTEHYGTLQSVAQNGTEASRDIMECYGSIVEVLQGAAGITEHYGALWDITEALRIAMECYGSNTEPLRKVTEPLRKTSFLPILN